MSVIGVIPARFNSKRLKGKALCEIYGHPMIWWVYSRVCKLKELDAIYVATDDERIERVCIEAGIPVSMTDGTHITAANRLWEFSEKVPSDFYVQINGDEPMIDIRAVKAAIPRNIPQNVPFGTNVVTEINSPSELIDASNIKVVFDCHMNALYMSRTPIPYGFKSVDFPYYKHVGVIGYNKEMLNFYHDSKPGRLETIEGIDTLRFLDYGHQLQLSIVHNCRSLSVDTREDLEYVREHMQEMIKSDEYSEIT